ncbi:YqjF family protein [Halorientalis brevis]|uniref:YqjF family protein n=1 Tax=Halorientalis brevis TaxID=1126241 RepID=A0ABD6CB41_9EURY|nr:DUF2071 domain-containing protein [Halorientalis brevis]
MTGPSLLAMRWEDVVFAHWAIDPAIVATKLPADLSVDTFDGNAYLSVVGFDMRDIRPRGFPLGRSFPELNLRTYVQGDAGPGIYFFNLDADDALSVALARRLFRLSYYRAEIEIEEGDDGVLIRSHRTDDSVPPTDFDATCRPRGDPDEPEPGTLAWFLTERYRFYANVGGGDHLFVGTVDHPSWPLQSAALTIRENDLFRVNGFETPSEDPLVHYSPGVDVTAGAALPLAATGSLWG